MKIKLKVFAEDSKEIGRYYRLAVIDMEKSHQYPANFVCLLPTVINNDEKSQNTFSKMFGNRSKEQAELLLIEALKNEDEREVKAEIERRLALLNPEKYFQKRCLGCGKMIHSKRIRNMKQSLCEDCFKKKYGHQSFNV